MKVDQHELCGWEAGTLQRVAEKQDGCVAVD